MPHEKLHPEYHFDQDRIDALREIAPEAFADGKINWAALREALGAQIEDDETDAEHFGLFWPGKREARRLASIPSVGTLVPVKGEGIDEETTGNIFIEGENLEVLKILRKSYTGRIKMIYIDPPYNTGNDFVYDDDFTEPLQEYLMRTGQIDGEGRPMTTNKKTDGRFHSKWLSMMYPRLRLARELLRDDGVIFVSIDDNELVHLRMLMNEVFGEENFLSTFIWNTEGNTDNQYKVKVNHEYIVCFCRNLEFADRAVGHVIDPNTREDSNLWKGFADNNINKNNPANPPSVIELPEGFPSSEKELFYKAKAVDDDFFDMASSEKYISDDLKSQYSIEPVSGLPVKLDDLVVEDYKLKKSCRVFSGVANKDKLLQFIGNQCTPIVDDDGSSLSFYINANAAVRYRKEREKARNILSVLRNLGTTEKSKTELKRSGVFFDYPKPVALISYLVKVGCESKAGIIMDYFAGSSTTAQAVVEVNREDGGNRKFILVQFPEKVPETSDAYKAGFETVASIGLDRTRKAFHAAGSSINPGNKESGFKYLNLASSHYKQWQNYHGDSVEELESLFDEHTTPLVDDWKSVEDGLFTEILLLEGFPLDSSFSTMSEYSKNHVRRVECSFHENRLLVCLDDHVEQHTIERLELADGDTFVCLDSAIDDETKTRLADKGLIKTI